MKKLIFSLSIFLGLGLVLTACSNSSKKSNETTVYEEESDVCLCCTDHLEDAPESDSIK